VELQAEFAHLVDGAAEGILRDVVVASPDAEERACRVLTGFDRDITTRVASADDQDALLAENLRILVAAGMDAFPIEHPRHLRSARHPVNP
jgi:hypothetical protein